MALPPPPEKTAGVECTYSPMTKVRLCFHDRCFDGTASAALFYRFYRERFDADAEFGFTGMAHRAAQPWEPELFDGDENVIVDFKFSNSPKVTWWFDHHQSAFLTQADAEQFRKRPGPRMFYEPDYKSCTKLIATVTKEKFGFDTKPLENLIYWGDIIDGAQYPTAQSAVELAEPATQLALVIEAAPENGLPPRIIPECASAPSLSIPRIWPGRGKSHEGWRLRCAENETYSKVLRRIPRIAPVRQSRLWRVKFQIKPVDR